MTAAEWFERSFGAPLPLPTEPLVHSGGTHWASVASAALAPAALVLPSFPDVGRPYMVIGQWGHGLGSQAFYFVRCEAEHRCFLRVGWGGAYDPPSRAGEIVAALQAYRTLRSLSAVVRSEIVYSIGTGHARLELDGADPLQLDAASLSPVGHAAASVATFMTVLVERAGG